MTDVTLSSKIEFELPSATVDHNSRFHEATFVFNVILLVQIGRFCHDRELASHGCAEIADSVVGSLSKVPDMTKL